MYLRIYVTIYLCMYVLYNFSNSLFVINVWKIYVCICNVKILTQLNQEENTITS